MSLNQIGGGLRTIHNGSNAVAKMQVNVPAGGELTVPVVVADQMQRDSAAFKDGKPSAELLAALAPPVDEVPEPVKAVKKAAPVKRLPTVEPFVVAAEVPVAEVAAEKPVK